MNGETKQGQAYGFKLNSLVQLTRSRTVDNNQSLLEYLYDYISSKQSDVLKFIPELVPLEEATTVDMPTLRSTIESMNGKLNLIAARLKTESKRSGDRFNAVMGPFHGTAVQEYDKLKTLRDSAFAGLKELGIWLNEPNDTNYSYLKTLSEFRKDFIAARKRVDDEKERIKKENEKQKQKLLAKQQREKNNKGTNDVDEEEKETAVQIKSNSLLPDQPGKEKNVSDAIIRALQSGDSNEFMQRLKARKQKIANTEDLQQQ